MPNHRLPYKFYFIDKNFVTYMYNMVIVEGWSFTYACSDFKGGLNRVRKSFKDWPELEAIYQIYLERMQKRPKRCNAGYQYDQANVNYNLSLCRSRLVK